MSSDARNEKDLALVAPVLNTAPGPEYASKVRLFQGIPSIERSPGGRLWAVWYSGREGEGVENYVCVVTSGDDGRTWTEPVLVIDPPGNVRAYDPNIWHDPQGRLWVFWAQSYEWFDGRCGVWCTVTDDPESPSPAWSEPRRIAHGIMMCKPTVLSTGEWMLPTAVWASEDCHEDAMEDCFSNVTCSTDNGATFTRRGGADVPDRSCDEHMVIERKDGSLWMLVRARYGVGQSFSTDGGFTWSPGEPSNIAGPCSRFFIQRLASGRLLLVNHYNFEGRSHMTALLSDDDGASWPHHLLLDERSGVSYPDGVQAADGRIYAIYDFERTDAMEILMAVFREEDILAGKIVSSDARLRVIVNKAG